MIVADRKQVWLNEETEIWVDCLAFNQLLDEATPFVGHRQEQTSLRELLIEPSNRLVTITGVGGMGKTQLSLAVARRFTQLDGDNPFPDGVFFVELAALQTADLLRADLTCY